MAIAPRPGRPGDVRPRVDPEPRVRLHRPAHRLPRPRHAHLRAPARQPDRDRGPTGRRQVVVRHEPGAQHRGRRASRSRSSRSRCRAGRSACACSAPRRACPGTAIRNKRVGPDDWTRVVQAAETLHDAPAVDRRLGQHQHRRHPRQGAPHAHRAQGPLADHRRLPPADERTRAWAAPPRLPPAGDRRDQPVAEDARQGARHPGDRDQPAEPRPRAPSGQAAAALRPARVGRDRAGRRRRDVHPPRRHRPGEEEASPS